MPSKRKRCLSNGDQNKRLKISDECVRDVDSVTHPVLHLYYPTVLTLRDYILSQLSSSSKTRRRRIAALIYQPPDASHIHANSHSISPSSLNDHPHATLYRDDDQQLALLLETTLVGVLSQQRDATDGSRSKDFAAFSQQTNSSVDSTLGSGLSSQSEMVDFAIWRLFNRVYINQYKPTHLLCHGYQRVNSPRSAVEDHSAVAGIPGVISHYPNCHVATIKGLLWSALLRLMGKEGERIMLDLLLDCGIFLAVDKGKDNHYQLSGIPLSDLSLLTTPRPEPSIREPGKSASNHVFSPRGERASIRTPACITFVRNRMMYARAALNAKGDVRFGLRHIHVLNRYPSHDDFVQTVHLLKYIFPRQYKLHNVFTSIVNSRETVQPFKDYTLREQEILQAERRIQLKKCNARPIKHIKHDLPKRLRGPIFELARKLQRLHSQCSYSELLKHYCPFDEIDGLGWCKVATSRILAKKWLQRPPPSSRSKDRSDTLEGFSEKSLVDAATPTEKVSAFCRAVMSTLLPNKTWGVGREGKENSKIFLHHINNFVRFRRFENINLHSVYQGLKINRIHWLCPPKLDSGKRTSESDRQKRTEILLEFLYYCFDSILIPLIRSNFHVTESNMHRNRLFYFRHDVWRALTEPSITKIKLSMFEEMNTEKARRLLESRSLGFSQIRLLPKGSGVRPIINLRRRVTKLQSGKVVLGRSINSVLAPVFNMLSYEKYKHVNRLGSSLFSVGDIYARLKNFRARLQLESTGHPVFYFAKVDVQSCFDSIPQRQVLRLIERLASENEYRLARHVELKLCETHGLNSQYESIAKATKKFVTKAQGGNDFDSFEKVVNRDLAGGKRNTVFVDNVVQTFQDKEQLLDLLEEHMERNIVKIGKKFFRQKKGIPQGSVLSSLLCNFFYAEFERQHLGFLGEDSQLLRLIDDFLLITTNKAHAYRFLQVMHSGNEDFGINVNPKKSLVNFDISIDGAKVSRLTGSTALPYCGTMIDTRTLDITKDRGRRKDSAMADSLTVEMAKTPGKIFYQKAMNTMKIQTHAMFLDTSFNSPTTVLSTMYENFVESAMKFYRYAKSLGSHNQPTDSVLIRTIGDLVNMGFVLVKSKHKHDKLPGYECAINKRQIEWLGSMAFHNVLQMKQSNYGTVLRWLKGRMAASEAEDGLEADRLWRVVVKGNRVFSGYKF